VRGSRAGGQSYVSYCRKLHIAVGLSRTFDVLIRSIDGHFVALTCSDGLTVRIVVLVGLQFVMSLFCVVYFFFNSGFCDLFIKVCVLYTNKQSDFSKLFK
jgi:hypothetical protein